MPNQHSNDPLLTNMRLYFLDRKVELCWSDNTFWIFPIQQANHWWRPLIVEAMHLRPALLDKRNVELFIQKFNPDLTWATYHEPHH